MYNRTIYFIAFILITLFNLLACNNDEPVIPADPLYKGDFVSAVHTTNGTATIDQERARLTLSNFKTDSGPDLNIYLATNLNNVTTGFIDLGDIKGVNGNYEYDLPPNTDLDQFKYVVVWCVDFNVNFGYAELVEQ